MMLEIFACEVGKQGGTIHRFYEEFQYPRTQQNGQGYLASYVVDLQLCIGDWFLFEEPMLFINRWAERLIHHYWACRVKRVSPWSSDVLAEFFFDEGSCWSRRLSAGLISYLPETKEQLLSRSKSFEEHLQQMKSVEAPEGTIALKNAEYGWLQKGHLYRLSVADTSQKGHG